MTDVTLAQTAFLVAVAFAAGTIDAIAGGGGLLVLPALLGVGLPPHLALGTNKGQSTFGTAAAVVRFWRAGFIDRKRARWTFPCGLTGSLLGAALVLALEPSVLRPVVFVMLIGVALFLALRRPPAPVPGVESVPPVRALELAALAALLIGAYDGFFGPGAGAFYITAFVLLGTSMSRASADAKVVNFASNLAAFALFAWRGYILWQVALPMAAAQLLGGTIGAHLAVKRGDRFVRVIALLVVAALIVKLASDLLRG